jgi:transcriptional regulator with XRE-family HTH domain
VSGSYQILGRQIAAARALTGLDQAKLAAAARISIATLRRMEASNGPAVGLTNNVDAVRRALESAGVQFTNDDQPGVRLRTKSRP